MKVLYPQIQCDYEKLDEFHLSLTPVRLDVRWEHVRYEFLINWRPLRSKTVVFGTGSIRGATSLPVFSRAKWIKDIPASAIFYFDPTVYLGDCDLGWGYGTNSCWYLERIATILQILLKKMRTSWMDVLYYGSSGGGFTSVMLAARLRGKALVINPQFFVENYFVNSVNRMKKVVLAPGERLISHRVNALDYFRYEGYIPQIHLHQNRLASYDICNQLMPFREQLQSMTEQWERLLRVEYYEDEGGHSAMPEKKVCLAMIREELKGPANGLQLYDSEEEPKNE